MILVDVVAGDVVAGDVVAGDVGLSGVHHQVVEIDFFVVSFEVMKGKEEEEGSLYVGVVPNVFN